MEETLEETIARRFVVVLNRTQDLVNIAGTVRAMMNMGLERLRLVRPDLYDAYRIAGIAHGSEWLLERVDFFDTLEDAVADAGVVIGTTARRRTASYVWDHPRDAAAGLIEASRRMEGPVCLVFGREDTGLLNEELDRCDRLLVVPTHPHNASLNLAQAALLVFYELRHAALASEAPPLPRPKRDAQPASSAELQQMFTDTEHALGIIEFFKSRNAPMIMRTLRAVVRRAEPTAREVKLMRAIAIEIRKFVERKVGGPAG